MSRFATVVVLLVVPIAVFQRQHDAHRTAPDQKQLVAGIAARKYLLARPERMQRHAGFERSERLAEFQHAVAERARDGDGRADTATNGDWYVYNCHAKSLDSSPLTIKFNAMAQGAEDANRLLGQGLAGKILSW